MYPQQKEILDRIERVESQFGHKRRGKVPLDGQALIHHCGLSAGPEIGALLQELKYRWRLGEWQTQEEGLRIAKQILSKLK